jgi:hypothetical protein
LRKKYLWLLAMMAEVTALVVLYSFYHEVEANILNVQGQFQERYADLHRQWIGLAGGIVLVMLILPFTVFALVREWRQEKR